MKIISLTQDTPEWHEVRRKSIGSSDISKILGVNPWEDEFSLFQDKMGLGETRYNAAMEHGKQLEPIAREHLGQLHRCNYEPLVAQHDEYPWMIASMDACNLHHGYILTAAEIKCSGHKTHSEYMQGKIPDYVYAQVQWQMHICGLDHIIVFAYDSQISNNQIEVTRNVDFIDKAVSAAKEFYRRMVEFDPPEPKHRLRDDTAWEVDSQIYIDICVKEAELDRLKKECKERLISQSGERNTKGCGITLTKIIKQGSIDVKRLYTENNIDPERYRGPSVEYWAITKDKS